MRWKLALWLYLLRHSAFYWIKDAEGDIGFRLFWFVTFVKYKEHTLVHFNRKFKAADKHQGCAE